MSLPPQDPRLSPRILLFTDLDGTLLDYRGYTWAPAEGAVRTLLRRAVPVVFCSSKTHAEQRIHQEELGIRDPMIIENGSGVVVPHGPLSATLAALVDAERLRRGDGYDVVTLGVRVDVVRAALRQVREAEGVVFRGYADMTLDELVESTGLPEAAARRAREREFSETVTVQGGPTAWRRLMAALEERGLRCFGDGPSGSIVGAGADKGKAVKLVAELYRRSGGGDGLRPRTAAIGDAANDAPMLRAVDRAFLVERRGGGWAPLDVDGLERVEGVGPVGWRRAVERLLEEEVRP
jgi:mannosyl-3-phosphoglycerate phosphatase family protein